MVSLAGYTNSHIFKFGQAPSSTPSNICCQIASVPGLDCSLTAATFGETSATSGDKIPLIINGTNCGGMPLNLTVYDKSSNTILLSVNFPQTPDSTGTYSELTSWPTQSGETGTYYFNATVYLGSSTLLTTLESSNTVTVSAGPGTCGSTCDQYLSSSLCVGDSCNAALATYTTLSPKPALEGSCNWTTSEIDSSGQPAIPANSCYYWNPVDDSTPCQPAVTSTDGWSDCTGGVQTESYYDANSCSGFVIPKATCVGEECGFILGGKYYATQRLCPYNVVNCGNGYLDQGEACDTNSSGNGAPVFQGSSLCSNYDGYTAGSLKCSSDCKSIDFSECTPSPNPSLCGNGLVDSGEMCDGTNFTQSDGTTLTCASQLGGSYTGSLSCSSTCLSVGTANCVPPAPSGCSISDTVTQTNWQCGSETVCLSGSQYKKCGCDGTYINDPQSCSGPAIDYCTTGNTLCYNQTSSVYFCSFQDCSKWGDVNVAAPKGGTTGLCLYGDGCGSFDCLTGSPGSDTCISSVGTAICSSALHLCADPGGVVPTGIAIPCGQGYTQCVYPNTGIVLCWKGDSCPAGTVPTSESCALGTFSGQSSSTCLPGLICINGHCSSPDLSVGSCSITSSVASGSCDNGFITYNVIARWSGTGPVPQSCQSGSKTIECPAQISLSFFTIYNLIMTIVILALIYIAIILARKKSLKKKSKNNKRSLRKKRQ